MSHEDSHTTSSEGPLDREALLSAGAALSQAQKALYHASRDYARSALLSAEQLLQAFPDQCAQLEQAVAALQNRVVSGSFYLPSYYRDGLDDGERLVTRFNKPAVDWNKPAIFDGVLRGLTVVPDLQQNGQPTNHLTYAIDPISLLADGPERAFYGRNYRREQFEQPFKDERYGEVRVYIPVVGVDAIDIDKAYLAGLEMHPRFLGRIVGIQEP